MSKTTTTVEPPPPILDGNGRPIPSTTYANGYTWCEETKAYEHDSIVTKMAGSWSRIIHPLTKRLGFAYYVERNQTYVRVMNREHKWYFQSYVVPFPITSACEVKEQLFKGLVSYKTKGTNKFQSAIKHAVLTKPIWDGLYKPNRVKASAYIKGDDTALISIGSILTPYEFSEFEAGFCAESLGKANEEIVKRRAALASNKDLVYPLVEVYAVWSNFIVGAGAFIPCYKITEPLYYYYNLVHAPRQFKELPL